MKSKKTKRDDKLTTADTDFGDYLARVVMHPQTPPALKSALQAVVVNIMSNETTN
jgi:hypothetical protein